MVLNRILYDSFGRRYKLHLLGDGPIPKHIKPKSFYDEASTISFLQSTDVSESGWRQLSHKLVGILPYTANPRDYLEAIARLFIQGRIQLFEINDLGVRQHPNLIEKRTFKQPDGKVYQFVTPTDQLINPNKKSKKFNSKKEAVAFVKKICPEEDLHDLTSTLNLALPLNTHSNDLEPLYVSIGNVIIEEKILISVDIPNKPPTPESIYEDVYIKPIPLSPPTNTKYVTFKAVDILGKPIGNVYIELSTPRGNEKYYTNKKGEVKLVSQEGENYRLIGICPECDSGMHIINQENIG